MIRYVLDATAAAAAATDAIGANAAAAEITILFLKWEANPIEIENRYYCTVSTSKTN